MPQFWTSLDRHHRSAEIKKLNSVQPDPSTSLTTKVLVGMTRGVNNNNRSRAAFSSRHEDQLLILTAGALNVGGRAVVAPATVLMPAGAYTEVSQERGARYAVARLRPPAHNRAAHADARPARASKRRLTRRAPIGRRLAGLNRFRSDTVASSDTLLTAAEIAAEAAVRTGNVSVPTAPELEDEDISVCVVAMGNAAALDELSMLLRSIRAATIRRVTVDVVASPSTHDGAVELLRGTRSAWTRADVTLVTDEQVDGARLREIDTRDVGARLREIVTRDVGRCAPRRRGSSTAFI